jgi:hypothetical protein
MLCYDFFGRSACFADVIATFTQNAVHILQYFLCWTSPTSPVFICVPQGICLALKMFVIFKQFTMHTPSRFLSSKRKLASYSFVQGDFPTLESTRQVYICVMHMFLFYSYRYWFISYKLLMECREFYLLEFNLLLLLDSVMFYCHLIKAFIVNFVMSKN